MDLDQMTSAALLRLHCELMEKLRERNVVRSSNNPVADYAETLVSKALGAALEGNSTAGFDAVGSDGTRYQIKARRLTLQNKSTQLSAIRNLDKAPFDQLAAVMFDRHLALLYAGLIPLHVVRQLSKYSKHPNAHLLHFRKSVMDMPGVVDITSKVQAVIDKE